MGDKNVDSVLGTLERLNWDALVCMYVCVPWALGVY